VGKRWGTCSQILTALSEQLHIKSSEEGTDTSGGCLGKLTSFLTPPSGKKREFRFHPIKETVVEEPVDITPYLDQLDESLRDKVLQLQKGRWVQTLPLRGPVQALPAA
jgi:hypothetical protein